MVKMSVKIKSAKIFNENDELIQRKLIEKNAYEKGYQNGINKRNSELLSLIQTLQGMMKQLKNIKQDLIHEYEPYVVDLALQASEKIIKDELLSGTVRLKEIIWPQLQKIPDVTMVKIRMNQEDVSLIEDLKKDFLINAGQFEVEIKVDPGIAKGGCLIETDLGIIDATLDTRINEVRNAVIEKNEI